jgi:hypothetical protein
MNKLEAILAAKEKNKFSWFWKKDVPEYKYVKEHLYFHLICGGCQSFYWVSWESLKTGRSKVCATCTRLPDAQKMSDIITKHKALWKPIFPLVYKSSSNKRRMFLMECACGIRKFVRWSHLSEGHSTGCRSCTSHLKKHGLSKDPIYVTWRTLHTNKRSLCKEWQDFVKFKKWAAKYYHPDFKLKRFDNKKPFSPDNCDYIPKSRKNIIIENQLPIGGVNLKLRKSNQRITARDQQSSH